MSDQFQVSQPIPQEMAEGIVPALQGLQAIKGEHRCGGGSYTFPTLILPILHIEKGPNGTVLDLYYACQRCGVIIGQQPKVERSSQGPTIPVFRG